ncbi:MAG: hypothetical protein ABI547_04035 [Betaproteobacteria bacterium]
MFTSAMLKTGLAIVTMSAALAQAAAIDEGLPINPPAVSNASTERFLGGVRDFGDGRPSPNIIYSTSGIAQATNSPEALQGPSVLSIPAPPPHATLGGSTLSGGTLERRTNAPYPTQPGQLERRSNTPYSIRSPW